MARLLHVGSKTPHPPGFPTLGAVPLLISSHLYNGGSIGPTLEKTVRIKCRALGQMPDTWHWISVSSYFIVSWPINIGCHRPPSLGLYLSLVLLSPLVIPFRYIAFNTILMLLATAVQASFLQCLDFYAGNCRGAPQDPI